MHRAHRQFDSLITETPMTALEKRTVAALAGLYSFRMLGLFMVLPLLSLYGTKLAGSTAFLVGLALGAYGLTQAMLQIPLGMLSDRIGRVPVIVFGLALFGIGSLCAAQAESIYGVIAGRLLQGAGAIAGTVMALLADLTSDRQRTKAMAAIGVSIGLSFAVALVLGPLLAARGGLGLVFNVTAALAGLGIPIVLFAVPRARRVRPARGETGTIPRLLSRSLLDPRLVRFNLGVFTLHLVLMALFLTIPPIMENQLGLHRDSHWKVYLAAVALSVAGMVPLMVLAERGGRVRLAFLLALSMLLAALAGIGGGFGAIGFYGGLWLFFVGFNYLEASLPSLVSKTVRAGGKGTALGIYATFQFLGAFVGGAGGGWLMEMYGATGVFVLSGIAVAIWWLSSLAMKPPRDLVDLFVRLPDRPAAEQDWAARLRGAPGVADLLVLAEENTVCLKVDEDVFDRRILSDLGF